MLHHLGLYVTFFWVLPAAVAVKFGVTKSTEFDPIGATCQSYVRHPFPFLNLSSIKGPFSISLHFISYPFLFIKPLYDGMGVGGCGHPVCMPDLIISAASLRPRCRCCTLQPQLECWQVTCQFPTWWSPVRQRQLQFRRYTRRPITAVNVHK